jgi:hypothetical protein
MKKTHLLLWTLLASTVVTPVHLILAGEDEGIAYFEKHIRPLLIEHCYECHSESEKIKGGLRLDIRQGWKLGGDSGKAIEPGAPEKSLLLEAIAYTNPDLEMPPKANFRSRK